MKVGVSVIVPAFNYARFLPDTLHSVLRQTHQEFEILLVDDGSTDDTARVAATFTDSRVRYLPQQNAGLSAARNTGLRAAQYSLVAFLDADDEWMPDFLQSAVGAFDKMGEQFALVACGAERMDVEGKSLPTKAKNLRDREVTVREILVRTRFMPSSVVARRSAFDDCGFFDTTLRSSEDRDMWIRIAARHRIFFVGQILVRVRKHGSNMSKNAGRMKVNMRRVLAKAFRSNAVSKWNLIFWLRVLSVHFFQISWTHFEAGQRGAALRQIAASLLLWPLPLDAAELNEPRLFRLRALARFLRPAAILSPSKGLE